MDKAFHKTIKAITRVLGPINSVIIAELVELQNCFGKNFYRSINKIAVAVGMETRRTGRVLKKLSDQGFITMKRGGPKGEYNFTVHTRKISNHVQNVQSVQNVHSVQNVQSVQNVHTQDKPPVQNIHTQTVQNVHTIINKEERKKEPIIKKELYQVGKTSLFPLDEPKKQKEVKFRLPVGDCSKIFFSALEKLNLSHTDLKQDRMVLKNILVKIQNMIEPKEKKQDREFITSSFKQYLEIAIGLYKKNTFGFDCITLSKLYYKFNQIVQISKQQQDEPQQSTYTHKVINSSQYGF